MKRKPTPITAERLLACRDAAKKAEERARVARNKYHDAIRRAEHLDKTIVTDKNKKYFLEVYIPKTYGRDPLLFLHEVKVAPRKRSA